MSGRPVFIISMVGDRELPKRPWDTCREVPVINNDQTPWKLIKLLKAVSLSAVAVLVFGLALCSKTSFLLLITLSNDGTQTLPAERKPLVLLCIGCSLVTSSVFLFMKSAWKACYKSSKLPRKSTAALVFFFEFLAAAGGAILTIVAMPHLDIVTNVTILNGVAILSALLQLVAQCSAKERTCFLVPAILAFLLIALGYVLFLSLYIIKDPSDIQMSIWVGLAAGGAILVSFNWWETYLRVICKSRSTKVPEEEDEEEEISQDTDHDEESSETSSRSVSIKAPSENTGRLQDLSEDLMKCQNTLHIMSSLLRILVTAGVLGAYVPLTSMDWSSVTSVPSRELQITASIVGVQLVSSALCHWFAVVACKMHALRRCFILPLYLASLAVLVLFVVPVVVHYETFNTSLNGTASNFTGYCDAVVDGRNRSLSVFQDLVLDVTHTLCFLDMSNMADIGLLTGSAASWWIGFVLATLHIWHLNVHRIQRTQDLFSRRLYEGAFIEQSLLLNTRFDIQTKSKRQHRSSYDEVMLYLCATMWHETYDEMMNIIISIFRLDKYKQKNFKFEAHIYFDDAFKDVDGSPERGLNEYAENLVKVFIQVYGIFQNINKTIFSELQQIPDQEVVKTPYGGRLVITMPEGSKIIVHFKDKDLIRHKKRWSQVMYLYYLLGWKLMKKHYESWRLGEDEEKLQKEVQRDKHNTYLLALDGDTDFQPAAVMLLIDRLKVYPRVGAACGRIHPTGSGPAVWFQKFEYAVSHWLQKTAEHVFGSVLCSPGCFSLFRAEALMDDNVMKTYSTTSVEASHYIQYDQGEDRWLCTLLLKQGWRVEYNAASDAYTNAPQDFKELYNQRRRWGPSTMANVVDLLGSSNSISHKNPSMSKPFMFYQLFAIISSILGPATICLLVAGGLSFAFSLPSLDALVISVIPPAIYLGLCFKLKADTQITIAAIMSIFYAFLMLVVTMAIISSMVEDMTILTPSSMFVIAMALIYIITAIMHPQEFFLVFYSFLYIICIPSAYLLLTIYSMVNMNNVSWGTRETKPAAGAAAPAQRPSSPEAKSSFQQLLSWFRCCKKEDSMPEPAQAEPQPQNTTVDDAVIHVAEQGQVQPVFEGWVSQLQAISSDMKLKEESLDQEEAAFWKELQEKYLQPLPNDKERQKKIANDLRELRNKINFAFFFCNALWLVVTFTLQISKSNLYIELPKVNHTLQVDGDTIQIEPIGFMFILGFALSVLFQFLAMFYHRVYTLIHYVAFVDTETKDQKKLTDDSGPDEMV